MQVKKRYFEHYHGVGFFVEEYEDGSAEGTFCIDDGKTKTLYPKIMNEKSFFPDIRWFAFQIYKSIFNNLVWDYIDSKRYVQNYTGSVEDTFEEFTPQYHISCWEEVDSYYDNGLVSVYMFIGDREDKKDNEYSYVRAHIRKNEETGLLDSWGFVGKKKIFGKRIDFGKCIDRVDFSPQNDKVDAIYSVVKAIDFYIENEIIEYLRDNSIEMEIEEISIESYYSIASQQ